MAWKIPDGSLIRYPEAGTLIGDNIPIGTGSRYAGWCQGGGYYNKRTGRVAVKWNEGSDHISDDLHVRVSHLFDVGVTEVRRDRLFQSIGSSFTCFSFGEIDSTEVFVIRETRVENTAEKVLSIRAFTRRVYEKRQITCHIATAQGSAALQFFISDHGVRALNKVRVLDQISIDGLTISPGTEMVVTNGTPSRFYTNSPSGVASAGVNESRSFRMEFLESDVIEILFDGVSFGQKLLTMGVHSSFPIMIHGFEGDSASGGCFYVGSHGGGAGHCMIKVTGIFGLSPAIAKVIDLSTFAPGAVRVEPSFKKKAASRLVAMSRTQSSSNSPMLSFSEDDGDTWSNHINGPVGLCQYSNFSVVLKGNWIIACASGNRAVIPDVNGNYQRGYVPLYLFIADYEDARAFGWPAFSIYWVGEVFHFNNIAGEEVNVTGVSEMLLVDDMLLIGTSQDTYNDAASVTSDGDVYLVRIHLGSFFPEMTPKDGVVGHKALGRTRGGVQSCDKAFIEEVVGSTTVHASLTINGGDGSRRHGRGAKCSKHNTGVYHVTFDAPLPSNRYHVLATHVGTDTRIAYVSSKTVNGFTVTVKGNISGSVSDGDVDVAVIALNDFARSGWGPA